MCAVHAIALEELTADPTLPMYSALAAQWQGLAGNSPPEVGYLAGRGARWRRAVAPSWGRCRWWVPMAELAPACLPVPRAMQSSHHCTTSCALALRKGLQAMLHVGWGVEGAGGPSRSGSNGGGGTATTMWGACPASCWLARRPLRHHHTAARVSTSKLITCGC